MLAELLPPDVMIAESFGEPRDEDNLFPEEAEWIAKAVDRRRREFSSVRACARLALAQAGLPPAAIVPGQRGEPGWPEGVVGSMTHCDGYRGCALSASQLVTALGIDAEPHVPLPAGVLDVVTNATERTALADLSAAETAICWDKILFSAKESVYKAWFPATGRWLGFEDAELSFGSYSADSTSADSAAGAPVSSAGAFSAALLVPGPVVDGVPLTAYRGRWLVRDGLIITAVAVPPAR